MKGPFLAKNGRKGPFIALVGPDPVLSGLGGDPKAAGPAEKWVTLVSGYEC